MKKFLLVMMAVCMTFAMISCGGDSGPTVVVTPQVTIDFDLNWPLATGAEPNPASVSFNKGTGLTLAQLTYSGTLPTNYVFLGYFQTASGAGSKVRPYSVNNNTTPPTITGAFEEDATLYARWVENTPPTSFEPDAEKVFLENGSYVIYKFEIPGTKTWSDYKSLTFTIALDATNYVSAVDGIRGARVLGFYTPGSYAMTEKKDAIPGVPAVPDVPEVIEVPAVGNEGDPDYVPGTPGSPAIPGTPAVPAVPAVEGCVETDLNGTVVMRMNNDSLNNYIYDNTTGFPNAITGANAFYTLTFNLSAAPTTAHAQWNVGQGDDTPKRGAGEAWPTASYSGPVFVAIGVTKGYAPYGSSNRPALTDGMTQWIQEVYLDATSGTPADDLIASQPAATEPQFVTYIDPVIYSWRGAATATVAIPETPAFIPPPAENGLAKPAAGTYDIKAMYYENPGNTTNQRGWRTTTEADIAKFAWAKYIEFEFDVAPNGGGTIVCISDYGDWSQGLQVFNGTGGTLQNGATLIPGTAPDKDRIRIELSEALNPDTFYKYLHQTEDVAGVLLSYWGSGTAANLADVGIDGVNKAWLIIE
jgi:hypothetical protein